MIDIATNFSAATLLKSKSSADIWKAIKSMWAMTYFGQPDYIQEDQGSNYVSREMKGNLSASGLSLKEVPLRTQEP